MTQNLACWKWEFPRNINIQTCEKWYTFWYGAVLLDHNPPSCKGSDLLKNHCSFCWWLELFSEKDQFLSIICQVLTTKSLSVKIWCRFCQQDYSYGVNWCKMKLYGFHGPREIEWMKKLSKDLTWCIVGESSGHSHEQGPRWKRKVFWWNLKKAW